MRRLALLLAVLAVMLPAVFAYAASFNVSYSGGAVIVVPVEDVVTEREGSPAAVTNQSPSVMTSIEEGKAQGSVAVQVVTSAKVSTATPTATPTPRQLPKVPQVAGFRDR
jgi:hypothetical protein